MMILKEHLQVGDSFDKGPVWESPEREGRVIKKLLNL
jgi:hypothetical protein